MKKLWEKRKTVLLFTAFLLLFFDAALKYWVFSNLPLSVFFPFFPYGGLSVLEHWLGGIDFSIEYVKNPGAILGLFLCIALGFSTLEGSLF